MPVDARLAADAQSFVAAGEASFHWDFSDGTTATDIAAGRDYTAPGTYTVTLTVTLRNGRTDTA